MLGRRVVIVAVLAALVAGLVPTAGDASAKDRRTGFEVVAIPVLESLDGEVLGWDGGTCVSVDPDPLVDDKYIPEEDFSTSQVMFRITGNSMTY